MDLDVMKQMEPDVQEESLARPEIKTRYSVAQLLEGAEELAGLSAQTASACNGNSTGRELPI